VAQKLLSLCMIVKDEAELLPRFLAHARGLWDELVAVDTGSFDATPRLLVEAGARVLHAPWTRDFAAARNVGLEAATGTWIAVLDPDELLQPPFVEEARALAADPAVGAATVRMVNTLPHGHARESRLLRLWRHGPDVRFRHAIHEDASDAVLAALARDGTRLVHLESRIDHLGYVRDRAAARGKKERDVGILDALLARAPGDLYAHLKRLEQARFWGDRSLWARAARAAEGAILAAPGQLAAEPMGGELLALMADGLAGEPAAALRVLDRHAGQVRPSAAFHLRRGELRERCGDPAGAREAFEACLALGPVTANRQVASVRPLLGLARLALQGGDHAAALARVDAALALAPRDPEALLAALALRRARGGGPAVDAFCRGHVGRGGDELWAAAGEEALRAADLDRAVPALVRSAGTPPTGPAARHLALAYLAAGELEAAGALAAALAPRDPQAALVGLLAALAAQRDVALEVELEPDEAERALRALVALLRLAARPAVLAALRAGAPAVAETFPWLEEALG
jgi:tetratricopeptide (TPR) repeat protein